MNATKQTTAKISMSWYQTNLDIVKNNVLTNPLFAIYFLRKVVMTIMDEEIFFNPKNTVIPIELINIYEMIERDLKRCNALIPRVKFYANYSAKLYTYINKYLGTDRAYGIFEQAKLTVLYDEQLMVSFKAVPAPPGQNLKYFRQL